MGAPDVLASLEAMGLHLSRDGTGIRVAPRSALTDEARTLIREHKAELLAALARMPEPAHAHGPTEQPEPDTGPALRPAPAKGADCMACKHLEMRLEVHEGTRRVFFWRCAKDHELMEGRNYGERILLAPPACEAVGDFEQWQAGQR